MALILLIFISLLLLSACLSSLEMALASVNRIRIKSKAQDGDLKAKSILTVIDSYEESITTIVVLNNIVNIILPTISTVIFLSIFIKNPSLGVFLSTIFMTIIILIFGEILPKTYGKNNSEFVLSTFIYFLKNLMKISLPITFLFIKINTYVSNKIFKGRETEVEVEDEILTMIEESKNEGLLEHTEEELIRNAIEFNDIRVSEIFQPKKKMFMIDLEDSITNIHKQINEKKYSRIPIYKENSDNIIGILKERDFLNELSKSQEFDISKIIKKVRFIPDTMKVSSLLPAMQKHHENMVIVVDEYGTVQGLITLEDIIEELVGEIWDDHDDVIHNFKKINENLYIVKGNIMLDDFNDLYDIVDINTETEDYTLAGYILEKIERIPEENEIIEDELFTFKVIQMSDQKIEEIEVRKK